MLWRRNQRSPSPPRLTSSMPEMERHLAGMGSASSTSKRSELEPSSTLSEDMTATSNQDPGCDDTKAVGSDCLPGRNLTDPLVTAEDNAKASTIPDAENIDPLDSGSMVAIRIKAQRCRPRFLVLLTCVSYLLFHVLGVHLGLRLINSYTEPRLNRAENQLQAAVSDIVSERIVHYKLASLLNATLEPQNQESYEGCLARGLHKADKMFLGVDFTPYADARDQTVDWVMDNCDRLHYTPHLYSLNSSRLLSVINSVRKSAENAFTLLKYRAALLRSKIRGIPQSLSAERRAPSTSHNVTTPAKMPFGFSLDCEGRSRCRPIHSGLQPSAADRTMMLAVAAKASKEMHRWTYPFKRLTSAVNLILAPLSYLQPSLFIIWWISILLSCPVPWSQAASAPATSKSSRMRMHLGRVIASLTQDEKLALGLFIHTTLYMLLHYEYDFVTFDFDRLLLPVGLGFCAFHVPQALVFFSPCPWKAVNVPEDLRSFCRAAHELYLIAQNKSVPDPNLKESCCPLGRRLAASSTAKPASKIGARFISPLTSMSEDLQQERKAMHLEQGKESYDDVDADEYGYATETDSEYDSDVQHASYVDLTGGATPTVSEDEEQWAVVED